MSTEQRARSASSPRCHPPLIILFCLLLSLFSRSGGAQSPPRTAAQLPRILVLGFSWDGALWRDLREAVVRHILDAPLGIALQPSLVDAELACTGEGCLESLSGTYHDAEYVLGGAISNLEPGKIRRIEVWLFKVYASNREAQVGLRMSRREVTCDGCTYERTIQILLDAVGNLTEAINPTDTATEQAPPQISVSCPAPPRRGFGRGFLLGSSIGLLSSAITARILLANQELRELRFDGGPLGMAGQAGLRFDDTGPSSAAYGVGALGLAGITTAAVPWGRTRRAPHPCAIAPPSRWTFGRGVATGLFTTSLLAAAASAAALMAADGSACVRSLPELRCGFTRPSALSWGFSSAWSVGLLLSLVIP